MGNKLIVFLLEIFNDKSDYSLIIQPSGPASSPVVMENTADRGDHRGGATGTGFGKDIQLVDENILFGYGHPQDMLGQIEQRVFGDAG